MLHAFTLHLFVLSYARNLEYVYMSTLSTMPFSRVDFIYSRAQSFLWVRSSAHSIKNNMALVIIVVVSPNTILMQQQGSPDVLAPYINILFGVITHATFERELKCFD